jgi:hypothetical protein
MPTPTQLPYVAGFTSAIQRLPVGMRSKALQAISRNANGPGGRPPRTSSFSPNTPRAPALAMRRLNSSLGIAAIEARVTGPQAATIAASPAGEPIVVTTGVGGSPLTVTIDAGESEAITWASAGTKTLTVVSPGWLYGELQLVV